MWLKERHGERMAAGVQAGVLVEATRISPLCLLKPRHEYSRHGQRRPGPPAAPNAPRCGRDRAEKPRHVLAYRLVMQRAISQSRGEQPDSRVSHSPFLTANEGSRRVWQGSDISVVPTAAVADGRRAKPRPPRQTHASGPNARRRKPCVVLTSRGYGRPSWGAPRSQAHRAEGPPFWRHGESQASGGMGFEVSRSRYHGRHGGRWQRYGFRRLVASMELAYIREPLGGISYV
jgi:hypothetical protein